LNLIPPLKLPAELLVIPGGRLVHPRTRAHNPKENRMKSLSSLLTAMSLFAGLASAQEIRTGATELSGTLAYLHQSSGSASQDALQLSPGLLYYPSSFLFVGPMFTFMSAWSSNISQSQLTLGGQAGVIATRGSNVVFPYLGGGFGMVRYAVDFNSDFGTSDSQTGTNLVVYGGLKIHLAGSFYLNIQPTYSHLSVKESTANLFTIGMGFSGILGGV
jgi:hypothetical protein